MAGREVWSKRVAEWRASGLTAAEFAVGRGFAGATLKWWSSELGAEAQRTDASPRSRGPVVRLAQVVRVPPARAASAPTAIVVELGGARVLVPTGADAATLTTVLAAVGAVA